MRSERDALMTPVPSQRVIDPRGVQLAWILRLGVVAALVVVLARVMQLQVAPSENLRSFVESRTSTSSMGSTRGDLLDRRGRTLATTRMGYQVVVDPEGLRKEMQRDPTLLDRQIVTLSGVLTTRPDEFAPQIIEKIVRNERAATMPESEERPNISRYLRIGEVLNQEQTQKIRELKSKGKLPGVSLEHHPVREQTSAGLMGSLVGKVAFPEDATERSGVLGAEKLFNDRLEG